MYKLNWQLNYKNETTKEPELNEIIAAFKADNPQVVAIDTETTGLNIVKDKPFLFIVAWKVQGQDIGRSFVVEYDPLKVREILKLFATCKYIVGANLKYDLHMLRNGGSPFPFEILNDNCQITDVRILRRLTMATDAPINEQNMALKDMAVSLVDKNANNAERAIKSFKDEVKKQNEALIKAQLKPYKWSLTDIRGFDDMGCLNEVPEEVRNIYTDWKLTYDSGMYYQIYLRYPEKMNEYACMDGVLTIEVFLSLLEKFNKVNEMHSNQLDYLFKQENSLIKIYYKQEEVGIKIDTDYLMTSWEKLADHRRTLRVALHSLLDANVSAGQHKKLIEIFKTKWQVPSEVFINSSTNKETFDKQVIEKLSAMEGEVGNAAKLIAELRHSDKYISTYVEGIYKEVIANGDGRLHPLSNQVGTVSGRISGNMQQHPKYPVLDLEGNELFHPRKAIVPSGNGYSFLVLQDFDQMELRVQAHYTIQYECPDKNLCKIFIPYGCYNKITGEYFNYDDPEHVANYLTKDADGNSIWIDPELNAPWIPVDPHSMHVIKAFGTKEQLGEEVFKKLRFASKTCNFSILYGCGLNGLLTLPALRGIPADTIKIIFNEFNANFAGVRTFQGKVETIVKRNLEISNVYGRIYRVHNAKEAYKCSNYVIQGACADLVKACLVNIDRFIEANHLKSRILYSIHDEIMWEVHDDEQWVIPYFEQILDHTAQWCKIPLTCGTDITYTTWADKKDISNFLKSNEKV